MDKDYYEFKYTYGDISMVYKFSSDIGITELADNLKYFLKGCSWTEEQVEELINGGSY